MANDLMGTILLDRFRVDAIIALGRASKVYRAWDLEKDIPLAVKMVNTNTNNNLMTIERFGWEFQPTKEIVHPNIVPSYGVYTAKDTIIFIEALIDCMTLKEYLYTHNALDFEEALAFMRPLCDALFYAHTNGTIHGDLKPSSILLENTGALFLSDFGLSQYVSNQNISLLGKNSTYMAPEQARGELVSSATDIYTLGVILFEMLTGEHPFQRIWESLSRKDATTPKDDWLRHAHLNFEPIDPSEIKPEITKNLSEIILCALDKNASLRYQSVQDFFSLLLAQNTQQDKKISIVPSKENTEYPTPVRRFLSYALKLPIIKKLNDLFQRMVKNIQNQLSYSGKGRFERAKDLLGEYELVFPLTAANINFDDIFIGRVKEVNQLHISLTSTRQGIVLVFGHRRAGKTKFIETALKKLEHRFKASGEILVSVSIPLASLPDSDMDVLYIILDALKKSLLRLKIYKHLDTTIKNDLDALLTRLDNEIQSEVIKERDQSLSAGVSAGASLGINLGGSEKYVERKTPKGKSFTAAVQDLRSILMELRESYISYQGLKAKPRIVITLDELDKVENITTINMMLNYLKPIFSSAGAHFVLIISVNQYITWASQQKDGIIYDSLNSGRNIYINCIWDTKSLLSLIANENNYIAKDDILFNPVEFFQHFLKYLSVQARGNLDKLWHSDIVQHLERYGGEEFLVFSRDEIREIKLYSGLYDLITNIMEDEVGDEASQIEKDMVQVSLYEVIVEVLNSKKHGITKDEIFGLVTVSRQYFRMEINKLIEILISRMLSNEYIEQSGQIFHLKKRRIIEKGTSIPASMKDGSVYPTSDIIDTEEGLLASTEFKEPIIFPPLATNIHVILKAINNTLFLTITDEDPMRFSFEDEMFYEKLDIGRGSENDLQIHDDKKVSRYHMRFIFSEDGWYVYDMNTANGTLVNGFPTTQTYLSDGDIIFLGNTVIKFLKVDQKSR
jgi:serine/threonine protein kinase